MALILKEGKTIKDPYNGEIATAYTNLKVVSINLKTGVIDAVYDTFNKKESRQNGAGTILTTNVEFKGEDFTPEILLKVNELIELLYVQSLEMTRVVDFKDGAEIRPVDLANIPITNWKSDEI